MCGFAGFVGEVENREQVLENMIDTIIHRGPDSSGKFVDEDAALGFRRLSIIDLSESGDQPLYNEDRSKVLVFNGEIYNYQELREELIQAGHTFVSNTDSETLIHGYEQWGEELVYRLRGMYAFAIWDQKAKRLFSARDIFGIKPLYYAQMNGTLMFGSEIKSFLEHPKFDKVFNEDALGNYLSFQFVPTNETFFKGVFCVQPGHYFVYENGKMTIKRYFEPNFTGDTTKSFEEVVDDIEKVMKESVEMHKISDVEVASYLSSGVDSSYLTYLGQVDRTFTVGFDEGKYSEIQDAKEFAASINMKNDAKVITPQEYWDNLSDIQYYMDEPLPNPSEVPLFFLAQNARKYVKVVLSGEGADELFGGYPMYLAGMHFEKYRKIPRGLRRAAASIAKKMPNFKGKNFIVRGGMEPYQRFMRSNFVFTYGDVNRYLKKDYHQKDPVDYAKPYFDKVKDLDEPTQLQYVDIHTWMLFDILQKADRMSMANSLELRVPFLDKKMLELAMQIPSRYRVHGDVTKVALRGAALKQLPERTANKKKLGFPVPLNDWLRQDKYYNMVKEKFEGPIAAQFFNQQAIMKLLDDHKAGKAANMQRIWSVYSFILWYEQFFVLAVKKSA